MAVLIDKQTRLLVQGITGREGTFHAKQAAAYGTVLISVLLIRTGVRATAHHDDLTGRTSPAQRIGYRHRVEAGPELVLRRLAVRPLVAGRGPVEDEVLDELREERL